ncbi:pyrimidine reductase family protein [Cryobacterium sp. TMT1-21]|uniref:Pyrimidine reductase family protein n=1 Tax=Cryobacterium shii TaxID=1259235 RepID=A0AAQ2C4C8_9MICO|nr:MULTISPECIES: pyrimidine reductase family protein [Cryobacterium]TFC42825.1 pyrimidine reductase family protein [Cryobacterium shii]TFC86694.1 pyrimidine reductase family protein [Cryobacterium sp. TmT2-59]TFD11624.1 pyrimidine reductase family protein [Cryobacterium sp. TMT4-10]TFD14760.1 pyrimidine reductase family protein [Cryobacterium sp. TMT1-21]TFD23258.1 pyrimidine reductase family protein [Cryobacterium sp. TMT2-23]
MLAQGDLITRYAVADRTVPRLRVNFISSLDGAATHDGLSGGLNNDDDKLVFDTLRLLSDVIVVGAGTVRGEGYGGIRLDPADAAWRTARGLPAQLPVAIVSSRLDIDPGHAVFTEALVRPLVVTHAASSAKRRRDLAEVADILICGEDAVDPRRMVDALAARGLSQVLCEGGPHLFGALIEADCVDELCLTISPVLEAGGAGRIARSGTAATRRMALLQVLTAGDMLFLRYGRREESEEAEET